MDVLNSFKLNDRPIDYHLIDDIDFSLNDQVVNFRLNAAILLIGNFRLLEDGFYRLLEDGGFRLLEDTLVVEGVFDPTFDNTFA